MNIIIHGLAFLFLAGVEPSHAETPFAVDGSTFIVAGGSVTLGGRLNAAAAGIKWADGTTSTTAAGSGSGAVIVATITYPNGTATQSALLACLPNSTGTWTQGENRALIAFSGSFSNNVAGLYVSVGVMVDGGFLPGYSSTQGNTAAGFDGTNVNPHGNLSFTALTPVLSAGSHTVCAAFATNSGTLTIPGVQGFSTRAQLTVFELNTGS